MRLSTRSGIVILLGFFLLAGSLSLNQVILYTPDSARYLAWANSLARFEGFKDATAPEAVRYVYHAPLYPLLLVPSAWFASNSILAAKVTTLLLGALLLFVFFRWTMVHAGNGPALFASFILAFNPLMLLYSTQILSDVPFAVCLVLYFMLSEPLLSSETGSRWKEFSFAAIAVAGVFLREVGLTLVLAAASVFLLKKLYRQASILLLSSVGTYLMWYLRNDIITAGIEHPAMTNTRLFFAHLYTPGNGSLIAEFVERGAVNLSVYKSYIGRLIFQPDFLPGIQPSVFMGDPIIQVVTRMLHFLQVPIIFLTLATFVVGLIMFWRKFRAGPLMALTLLLYLILILLYPINDVRFLFPVLVIMIFCGAVTGRSLIDAISQRSQSYWPPALVAGIILLLAIPNLGWTLSFVETNVRYNQSIAEFTERIKDEPGYPERMSKPIELAGAWIDRHSDRGAVIACRRKELFFEAGGRRVLDLSNSASPDAFEQLLRDYNIRFMVSDVARNGLREDELLRCMSQRHDFRTVYRAGNIEVLTVTSTLVRDTSASVALSRADSLRQMFRTSVGFLLTGTPQKAESLILSVIRRVGGYTPLLYLIGSAKELDGDYAEAVKYFQIFRSLPQGGWYTQLAAIHLEIITRLKAADAASTSGEKAALLYSVALRYWELGFRQRCLDLLERSLNIDPEFIASRAMAALYSLRLGDTLSANRHISGDGSRTATGDARMRSITAIVSQADSLRGARSPDEREDRQARLAEAYAAAGFPDWALDEYLRLLQQHPQREDVLRAVAELYEARGQYAVMKLYLMQLCNLHPDDRYAREKLQEHADRW